MSAAYVQCANRPNTKVSIIYEKLYNKGDFDIAIAGLIANIIGMTLSVLIFITISCCFGILFFVGNLLYLLVTIWKSNDISLIKEYLRN